MSVVLLSIYSLQPLSRLQDFSFDQQFISRQGNFPQILFEIFYIYLPFSQKMATNLQNTFFRRTTQRLSKETKLKSYGKFIVRNQIIQKLLISTFNLSLTVLSRNVYHLEIRGREHTFPLFFSRLSSFSGLTTRLVLHLTKDTNRKHVNHQINSTLKLKIFINQLKLTETGYRGEAQYYYMNVKTAGLN